MTYFLPRVVGPSRALEILLDDPNMTAADALAERIVSEVVPADELMDRAREGGEAGAPKAPHYVRMAKLLCGQSIENSLTDHLQVERHGIADSMATEDLRAGVAGVLRRREAGVQRPLNAALAATRMPAIRVARGNRRKDAQMKKAIALLASRSPRSPSSPAAATTTPTRRDRPPQPRAAAAAVAAVAAQAAQTLKVTADADGQLAWTRRR